ncbi:hypothetical protein DMENIID0001_113580 [Sergentomyia squamirostris]
MIPSSREGTPIRRCSSERERERSLRREASLNSVLLRTLDVDMGDDIEDNGYCSQEHNHHHHHTHQHRKESEVSDVGICYAHEYGSYTSTRDLCATSNSSLASVLQCSECVRDAL